MATSIRMSIHIPSPVIWTAEEWRNRHVDNSRDAQEEKITYQDLCRRAGVRCRISGEDLRRTIVLARQGESVRIVGNPDTLRVVANESNAEKQALRALEVLAYGFHDYAAREAVCGRGYFRPLPPPGRPRSGRALTSAERVRNHRNRRVAN